VPVNCIFRDFNHKNKNYFSKADVLCESLGDIPEQTYLCINFFHFVESSVKSVA